ncbi:hypothetical protein LTR66_002131 [Elasticomyces elasticus]|nr:hypothetical protein LTR50_001528 [Elasticomyces elasticus]KAK4998702.1 hypothetical protein LTR66_002131 [Elasticomyces elasticus]
MYQTSEIDANTARLRQQIAGTEAHLRQLKVQLSRAEQQAKEAHNLSQAYDGGHPVEWQAETLTASSQGIGSCSHLHEDGIAATTPQHSGEPSLLSSSDASSPSSKDKWPLSTEEYRRYGRQLILPEVGLQGQLRLKSAKVLVVGVGGLGCPAAAYLVGAGVGTLGLVDGDTVEVSNLHRQILHSTNTIGIGKVDSAVDYLNGLNSLVNLIPHRAHLTPQTALEIISSYDAVLDCTDHPTSRYLISDACVLLGKPLVSASALRTEGQLMVLNVPPKPPGDASGGPCYRCIFPKPPPAESVVSCGEGGILGPVVGVMGVLQALETIKIIASGTVDRADSTGKSFETHGKANEAPAPASPSLLLFSAFSSPPFRSVRLRPRRANCASCSAQATITEASLTSGSLDYVAFCGVTSPLDTLAPHERIGASEYSKLYRSSLHVVLDVREPVHFELSSLPGAINLPWSECVAKPGEVLLQDVKRLTQGREDERRDVLVVCRLGNDSQLAVAKLKQAGWQGAIKDLRGGLRAWRQEVDPDWPDY